jgi:arylsulfatase A-like enzyme
VDSTRRTFFEGAAASLLAGFAPRPRREDRPNVLLIVIDTLRTDHVYGKKARTPNMDALIRRGLSFSRCYPEAMPTVPARRSIMTGRRVFPFKGWHPWPQLPQEPGWAPIAEPALTFTSVLRRAGWWTACVTDNTFLGFAPCYAPYRGSFNSFVRRGGQAGGPLGHVSAAELHHWLPREIDDPETRDRILRYLANGGYSHDETRSFSARVFRSAAALLDEARRRRPFALVVDAFEPHEPWTPPRRYIDMYGDPDYRGQEPSRPWYRPVDDYLHGRRGEVLLERMKALYAAEVTLTDRWLGVFLDRLHELRLDRDTIVVFVSDHGIYLGDYGLTGKSSVTLHPTLIRVPFAVIDPRGRHAGRTSSWFASTHDIAPTILSMAGVPAPEGMDGVDLSPLFEGRRPRQRRPYAFGGYGNSFFVRTDRWAMYGANSGGGFHLYDRRADVAETRDVSAAHPGKVAELYGVVRRRSGRPLRTYPF